VKEVWDVPKEARTGGRVIHTMGWPLRNEEFGGGFIYNMAGGRVSIGFVIGLDYLDPRLDPHERFQEFKTHPFVKNILEGGTLHSYGAKTIPEGGYWALPQYYFNGGMIAGDAAGFLNAMRLKGIHLALKTGQLAAQAAHEALQANDVSASRLKRFQELVESSWVKEDLWKVRNFHQAFEHGFAAGVLHTGNPCQFFCPAAAYEMTKNGNSRRLQINFSNCVHCKTCDIMDPYEIINWVTPQGGDGPGYELL
jgi:electron-transferring-flavoprotein dehydrogenase